MTAVGNIGEIVCIGFVFIVLHHPTGVSWGLLGLSRRQYKVYEKKIFPITQPVGI